MDGSPWGSVPILAAQLLLQLLLLLPFPSPFLSSGRWRIPKASKRMRPQHPCPPCAELQPAPLHPGSTGEASALTVFYFPIPPLQGGSGAGGEGEVWGAVQRRGREGQGVVRQIRERTGECEPGLGMEGWDGRLGSAPELCCRTEGCVGRKHKGRLSAVVRPMAVMPGRAPQ